MRKTVSFVLGVLLVSALPSIAQAQFGDLLKGLKDAAKELEKATQQQNQTGEKVDSAAPSSQSQAERDAAFDAAMKQQNAAQAAEDEEAKKREEDQRLAEEQKQREERAGQQAQLKELNEKGPKFLKESTTKWEAFSTKDPMTGKETEFARAKLSGGGVEGFLELRCEVDPNDKLKRDLIQAVFRVNNLRIPTQFRAGAQWATGRIAVNGRVIDNAYSLEGGSIDKFHSVGAFGPVIALSPGFVCRKNGYEIMAVCSGGVNNQPEKIEYIHTFMMSIKTFKGELLAQIPTFHPAIRSVVKDCKGK